MEQMKQKINTLKENKKVCMVVQCIILLIHTYLFTKMVLNLGYAWEVLFQVFKDYYIGIAVFHFLLSLAFLQRVKITNIVNIIFVIGFTVVAHFNMQKLVSMPDLYNATIVRWMCGGLMCVLLIDMIMYKKIAKIKERNLFGTICYLVVAILVYAMTNGVHYTYILLFPFLCLFLLRIDKNKLKKWFLCLSVGYYLAFLYTMIKSFITVPYTGERYYGIYMNHGFFGIFIGGAFVCVLWWLILLIKKKAPIWQKLILLIPMGFSLVCSMMNGARVAQLAIIMVAFVAICIWGGAPAPKQVAYRIATVAILACILLIVGFGALYMLNSYEKETLELTIDNDIVREQVLYWHGRARTLFKEESKHGIFAAGSIVNAIDRFSSGRFSHWAVYLQETDMNPETNFVITINDYKMPHPHSVYVYWLYGLGWIPGFALIAWIISYLVQVTRQIFKKKDICILPFLWLVYYLVAGINESIVWIVPAGFLTMLFYYPVIMKYDELKQEEKEEQEPSQGEVEIEENSSLKVEDTQK